MVAAWIQVRDRSRAHGDWSSVNYLLWDMMQLLNIPTYQSGKKNHPATNL